MTHTKEKQLRYWTAFIQYLKDNNSFLIGKGNPQGLSWHAFDVKISQVKLEAVINTRGEENRVELYLTGPDDRAKILAKERFSKLKEKYESDASNVLGRIIWDDLPNCKLKKVMLINYADIWDEKKWTTQFQWLKNGLEALHNYFEPKLKMLMKE